MSENRSPHIIIICDDQHAPDCLGCAGHPVVKTPNIDALAIAGVRFSQAYTTSPVCMAARASLITGLYPHNHGIITNMKNLPRGTQTYFHHLQRGGYRTAHIGKSHYYNYFNLAGYGCTHMREMEGYLNDLGIDDVHEVAGYWGSGAHWSGDDSAGSTLAPADSYVTDYWRERGVLDAFREDYRRRCRRPFYEARPGVLETDDYLDSYVGRKAVEYIHTYNDAHPFFLFVGFPGPHLPFDTPGEFADLYDPVDAPPAIPGAPRKAGLPEYVDELIDDRSFFVDFRRAPAGTQPTREDIQRMRASYFGKTTLVDHWIGKINEACVDRGIDGETIVVFLADHGEMLGDHNRIEKNCFYDSSVRIPLIISDPSNRKKGVVSDCFVELIDLFPTLFEAAGLEPSPIGYGSAFTDVLYRDATEHRSFAYSEGLHGYMVRDRESKYAVTRNGGGFMLFDAVGDPYEQHNMAGDVGAAAAERGKRDKLLRRLASTPNLVS